MIVLQTAILLFVAAGGTAVVLVRQPISQAIMVSFYGLLLSLLFFVFQAPDVGLSQITVGAVALPLMILLALARVKKQEADQNKKSGDR
jgi:energy-converting hydrogenase B subunit D